MFRLEMGRNNLSKFVNSAAIFKAIMKRGIFIHQNERKKACFRITNNENCIFTEKYVAENPYIIHFKAQKTDKK